MFIQRFSRHRRARALRSPLRGYHGAHTISRRRRATVRPSEPTPPPDVPKCGASHRPGSPPGTGDNARIRRPGSLLEERPLVPPVWRPPDHHDGAVPVHGVWDGAGVPPSSELHLPAAATAESEDHISAHTPERAGGYPSGHRAEEERGWRQAPGSAPHGSPHGVAARSSRRHSTWTGP
jgi:hypothetical protein